MELLINYLDYVIKIIVVYIVIKTNKVERKPLNFIKIIFNFKT